jgi:hypothetical protein
VAEGNSEIQPRKTIAMTDCAPRVAALFVETDGSYFGLKDVDPWDYRRDARKYPGPFPVVAHPPCQRWGKFWAGAPLVIKRTGTRKRKGDDDGCFSSAVESLRRWGGILEHPLHSHAWAAFGLNQPPLHGGWITADFYGGWTCAVEQGRYGHYARKPTMLLAYRTILPELRWGVSKAQLDPELVARIGEPAARRRGEVCSRGGGTDSTERISTPTEFRDLLLSMARSVKQ